MHRLPVRIKDCSLNLGELHKPDDFGFFHPVFRCVTAAGEEFTAAMRLHITEPLNPLVIADPRRFPDAGVAVNSAGSKVLRRRSSYDDPGSSPEVVLDADKLRGVQLYEMSEKDIRQAVLRGYNHEGSRPGPSPVPPALAFTCHDPGVIGGGNTILFRFINWLADLGVRVTVYSCGRYPSWTRVRARFRLFTSYRQMCTSIDEDTVVLYSMWHIEPMLQAHPRGKRIFHLRQIYEAFHYGADYDSMMAAKPVVELLEGLPIGLITISPHLSEWYREKHQLGSLLVTNGISPDTFWPLPRRSADSRVVRVVSVGDPRHFVKGFTVLRSALCALAAKRPRQAFEWIAAGGPAAAGADKNPPPPPNLTITLKSGLSPANMRALYQSATLVVNPSLYEGFGLPTLEAMACGAPVVQADNRGLDTIIAHEINCLVVPVNDPAATAAAMERLLSDNALFARLSAAGIDTARKHTTRRQFEMFVPAFEQVLRTQFPRENIEEVKRHLEPVRDETASRTFAPLISVVIPSYNQAGYLRQALDSLLAQTYTNWEAVVMNDGSSDNTVEVMKEYAEKDSRVRPFTKPNGGITSALNAGLEHARGDFFCWLSSDDLFYPQKLEWQVRAFEQVDDSCALVYGSFDILEEETGNIVVQPFQEPLAAGAEFPEALKFDFIDGCTIMIRMSVMREVGGFNRFYRHSQDMELWVRIASRGYRFRQLERKLTIRRVHVAQSSTGNMIHCRYDAAWMINFYLDHFHLLEVYRYFALSSADGLNRMLSHLVGRMTHTESNVNHPLLQEKFWSWILRGIRALPVEEQTHVLRALMKHLLQQRHTTQKMEYYLAATADALRAPVEQIPFSPVYDVEGRDIHQDSREADAFGGALFDYGCNLLVNANTPLFAQELYFHNTHKVVDTPYKLGHSIFRYLSQFPNAYRERVSPFAKLSDIPSSPAQAVDLFCRLRYPEHAEAFRASMAFDAAGSRDLRSVAEAERQIAGMSAEAAQDLRKVCEKNPTETILFYWLALAAAGQGRFAEAVDQGWRTMTVGHRSCDWRIAYRIGEWAERAGDAERAYAAFAMAAGMQPEFREAADALARLSRARKQFKKRQPTPVPFISTKDVYTIPDARLTKCTVIPRQDGLYDLACSARAESAEEFHARARLPYAPEFEPQVIADPATGNHYKITAETLFTFWSGGYDFDRESRRYIAGILKSAAPPRLAFTVLNGSVMGGGTRVLYRFVNWLSDLGVEVGVYSNDAPPQWTDVRGSYHHIEDAAQRYAAITEPVVLVYSILEMPGVLQHCTTVGKRILHFSQVVEDFNYHGATVESLTAPKAVMQILQSLPVGRVAISGHIRDYFRKHYQQESFTVVNGIDLTTWKPGPVPPMTLQKTIFTAGNPTRLLKGASDVRQAVAILAKHHPDWKINLVIASGERVSGYAADTSSLGFTTVLHCGLSAEAMRDLYRQADVYVNAAWYEGFGLPSIEAMACGVPVVQADNSGLDGIICHGENCFVVRSEDPEAMAGALEKTLSDDTLRRKLIAGGTKTALTLGTTQQFDMFVPVFEDLLGVKFDGARVTSMREILGRGETRQRVSEVVAGMAPRFSVLVPVYNQAQYLPAALNSLIAQVYPNWEAIVVNDGSTDGTAEVLEQFAGRDARIRPFHKPNGGVASALNYALRQARSEWICWLSSDDLFRPEKLQIHAAEIERNPDVRFYHTHYYTTDEKSGKLTAFAPELPSTIPSSDDRIISLLHTNYVNGISVCVHRSVFDDIGAFNESYRWGQDFDLWLRMAGRYAPKFLSSRTCVYRLHAGQDSRSLPEAGSFDSARSSVAFLNGHGFPDLFPSFALQEPGEIFTALRKTLAVAAHPGSFLNQIGCTRALIDRLHEWLSQSCPIPVRAAVHAQLLRVIDDAQASATEARIKGAFSSLRSAGEDGFVYAPMDPLAEAQAYAAECESDGRAGKAAVIRKYLQKVRSCQAQVRPASCEPAVELQTAAGNERRPLTITYLVNSILGITGGNQTLLQQANELVRRGHTVHIVTYSDRPAWFDIAAHVITVPDGQPLAPSVPRSDVVVSTYFLNTPELQNIPAPVKLYFAQGDQFLFEELKAHPDPAVEEMRRRFAVLSRESYMYPDVRLVANSRALASRVEKKYGRRADAVLPVCIDHATFRPLQRSACPPYRILVVGPDVEGNAVEPLHFKGMEDVRRALAMLTQESSRFTVVRISNSERSIFKDVPCEFYVAPSPEMKTFLYGTAHILVYASHYESWGLPPLEAMASGAAVVCTATEASAEYCRHEENALLVPPRTPEALARALNRLMHDPALMRKLVEGGYATARSYKKEREWDELEEMLYRFSEETGPLEMCQKLFSSGRFDEACRKALDIEHDLQNAGTGETQISALEKLRLFRGYCHLELKDLDQAKDAFQSALEANPSSSAACTGLGTVFMQAGQPEAAKTMFEWGVKNDPANQAAVQGLAGANRELGLPESHSSLDDDMPAQAAPAIDSVLEEAYRLFGEQRYDEALRLLASVEDLVNPGLPEEDRAAIVAAIENFRGHSYLALNDLEQAKQHFENGLHAHPQSSQACAGLGRVFHLSGNPSGAKTMYEWAVKCDRTNASAVKGLAEVNAGLGLPDDDNTLLNSEHVPVPENV